MRPVGLDELGEEPIYCEAHHDDAVYSGSEDDYYEEPEHRRLRIEAKALQFLAGNVPYLLSATLQGPFDNKSWDNPWKSKRAQREARRRGTHNHRSMTDVEAPRGHGSGKAADDLPDTQRTSLYPLPSPETTNPPSTSKKDFVDEFDGYSRIKTWREAVKSIPVTKDPFWGSRKREDEDAHATKKRSAGEDWLHTRGSNKRKSIDRRKSPLTESPSQAAARMRRSQARPSEKTTQSASISSSREGVLAARRDAQAASFDSSRLANAIPDLLQTARSPQSPKTRLLCRELERSEDELSMPSTTGSMEASRSPGQKSTSPTSHRSLARQMRGTSEDSAPHTSGRKISDEQMLEQAQDSRFSVNQYSAMNITIENEPAKDTARRSLEASQQDNSFYFHARPRNQAEQPEACQSATSPIDGTTISLPSAQMRVLASMQGMTGDGDGPELEDGDGLVMAHAESRVDLLNNVEEDTPQNTVAPPARPGEAENEAFDGPGIVHEATTTPQTKEVRTEDIAQGNQESDAEERMQQKDNETCPKPDTDRPAFVCTQELSPVSMHGSNQPAGTVAVSEDAAPQRTPSADDDGISTSEWSTYINTQENASGESSNVGDAEDIDIVSHGPDDVTDPAWTTFVNTPDPTAKPAEGGQEVDAVEVVNQGFGDLSESDWSTILNTQDQLVCLMQEHKGLGQNKKRDAMDIDANEQGDGNSLVHDDVESNSDWSTYMSTSSQIIADQTGNTSHEPVQTEDAASEAKSSQVSVGAIINAYAEEYQLSSEEIKEGWEGNATIGDLPDGMVVSTGQEDDEVSQFEMHPRQPSCEALENQEDIAVSVAHLSSDVRAVRQPDQVEENPSTDIDITTAILGSTENQHLSAEEAGHALQAPRSSQDDMEELVDPGATHGTPASVEPRHIQSPWHQGGNIFLRTPSARLNHCTVLDETNTDLEATTLQSPWAKESMGPPVRAVLDNDTSLSSSSNLHSLASRALLLSEAPQTPWLGDKLPSPDFSLSVKRFSDFMRPSPTKKRASASGSILRGSGMSSRVLFGTPVPLETKRRVTFAPLPGEKEGVLTDVAPRDEDELYVEEDVSYFDIKGKKTASIRVTRPTARVASPPPSQVNAGDAGELPDHDHKFAKHFEVMSKRKKNLPQRRSRLLPSDSQEMIGSQELGAMAEAFIEASQTRKRAAELAEASANSVSQSDDPPAGKNLSPVAMNDGKQQENVDPVDDVSAVLDNLSDFLDNTWGMDMSMDMDAEVKTPARQQTKTASSRFDNVGDPLLSLNVNVWAD